MEAVENLNSQFLRAKLLPWPSQVQKKYSMHYYETHIIVVRYYRFASQNESLELAAVKLSISVLPLPCHPPAKFTFTTAAVVTRTGTNFTVEITFVSSTLDGINLQAIGTSADKYTDRYRLDRYSIRTRRKYEHRCTTYGLPTTFIIGPDTYRCCQQSNRFVENFYKSHEF